MAPPGEARVYNEQLRLLRLLYSDLPPDLRAEFVPTLFGNLTEDNAAVVMQAVLDVGNLDDIDRLLEAGSGLSHARRAAVWMAILERVVMESHRFSDHELFRLDNLVWRDADVAEALARSIGPVFPSGLSVPPLEARAAVTLVNAVRAVPRAIERAQYVRLRTQLTERTNPEINTDRAALISRMGTLGCRPEIVEALDQIERELVASTKPIEFKTCVDLCRTAFEEIVEDAARKVSAKTGHPLPPSGASDFHPWKQLLRNAAVLTTDEEADLFQKLYNYLSTVGTHRLGSGSEHVRVARNMVIELGLLLLGRVQALVTQDDR